METEYRRDLQHSYLVIHVQETQEQDYTVRMISENRIDGLLALEVRRIDRQLLFYYDITSKISVEEYCQFRKITGNQIRHLLYRLVRILTSMEEYLLGGEGLCLRADYIFADAEFTEIEFCYIPGQKNHLAEQFQALMEFFLPVLNHEKKEEILIVYQIYGYAVQEQFSLDGLRKLLQEAGEEEHKKEEKKSARKEKINKEIQEEGSNYNFRGCQDDEFTAESYWTQKTEHERALEAFFEDEPEEKRMVSPWITVGAVLAVCCLLAAWYIWRNWREYFWSWTGFSICVIAVYAILSNRFLTKGRRSEEEKGRKGIEEEKEERKEREDTKRGNPQADNHFFRKNKASQESEPLRKPAAAWQLPDEWEKEEAEEEEYTRILQPERLQSLAVFQSVFPDTGQMIPVTEKKVQLIGHQEGMVDVFLGSHMVSRIHAKLRREDGHFYLCDLNSRNGTWVNGQALEGKTEIELQAGDEVKFADHVYHFICGS